MSNVTSDSFEFKTDGGEYYTEGILEVADYVDVDNDVVTQNCITDMAKQIDGASVSAQFNIKGNLEHEHVLNDSRIIPRAKVVKSEIKGNNLFIRVQLNKHHPEFKSLWGSINDGFIDAYSMEFKAIDYKHVTHNGKSVRVLDRVKLGGVGYTGRPVCEVCKITDFFIKSKESDSMADDIKPEEKPEAEPETTETPEPVTETGTEMSEMKAQLDKLTSDLELKNKELSELKDSKATTVSKDDIKSMITEAVSNITPAKPQTDNTGKFEKKSADMTFIDRIVMAKTGSE